MVELSSGAQALFISATDGFLYKIDPLTGNTLATRDTRRRLNDGTLECADDSLEAGPVVVVYRLAGANTKTRIDASTHPGDDIVVVPSYNGCDDFGQNHVLGLFASDLEVAWDFNRGHPRLLGPSVSSCVVAYDVDSLFCGTLRRESDLNMASIWALAPANSSARWSNVARSLAARPVYFGGVLYTISQESSIPGEGSLKAWDPGGQLRWSMTVPPAELDFMVANNPADDAPSAVFVDSTGVLRSVVLRSDNGHWGPSGTVENGVSYTSAPVTTGGPLHRIYVGRSDGSIRQLTVDLNRRGIVDISEGGRVFDPALDQRLIADQTNTAIDTKGHPLTIGGRTLTRVAQVLTAGATGRVVQLQLPIACETGDLTVELHGVTAGAPNDNVLASRTVRGSSVPMFGASPVMRTFSFDTPVQVSAGQSVAVVLISTGDCGISVAPRKLDYAGGNAFERTESGGTWKVVKGRDVPFMTVMLDSSDPARVVVAAEGAVTRLIPDFGDGVPPGS